MTDGHRASFCDSFRQRVFELAEDSLFASLIVEEMRALGGWKIGTGKSGQLTMAARSTVEHNP